MSQRTAQPGRPVAPLTVLVAIPLLLFGVPFFASFIADVWWFREVGYEAVFTTQLTTRVLLFLVGSVLAAVVLRGNLGLARRGVALAPFNLHLANGQEVVDLTAIIARIGRPLVLVASVVFGLSLSSSWDILLPFAQRVPFGVSDPVFARDVGYYVFTLPALTVILTALTMLTMLSLVIAGVLHFARGNVVVQPRGLRIAPAAGRHLGILLAIWFVLAALRLWFIEAPSLLFSTTGPLVGASYTDLHAQLPAIRISAIVAAIAAVLAIVGAVRRELGLYAFLGIGAYLAAALLGRGLFPLIIQKFVVAPTELTRESPYIAHHIAATRQAWGLDSVETRELGGDATLTLADLQSNAPTIENVRLWDRAPLLRTFGQLQEIRTYYDFVSVDDDRYWIDGKYRQVLLSPRELNPASLPTRTFINEHLTFTHGMGLTMSPVNQVTTEGLPVLFVKDLPPSTTGSLKITRPQIYFGELADQYVIVGTRQREFDYPSGDANIYSEYKGRGGVPVGNIFRRALLATHFRSLKILLSGDISSESRILYNRHITNRVRKALPFLSLDRDPYLVVADDGTLKWIQDAFTTSGRYPYSFRTPAGVSYMRNSVKIVIDAYDGSITAYQAVSGDPIIQAWSKVFPGLIVPLDSMPKDLRAHIRYPDDLFRAQTSLYTTYHMDRVEDFYHREDQWQIPVVTRPDESVPFMRHIVMRLPNEDSAEFIYMAPFTPRGKDNLAAWMVARNDGETYGKLRVYRLPRQSLVFGPRQIENRINQDTEVSRQVSLWDQGGSEVIRGDLLVIPIEEALLYVQPLYLQAEGGRIPELKRVVVAYQNRVVMRETLDAALADLFGKGATTPAPTEIAAAPSPAGATGEADRDGLAAEARSRYQAALEAQRAGDWAKYGEEIRQLGILLDRLAGRAR